LRPPRRATQDDAALRRADEVDQVLNFLAGQRPIVMNLLKRACRIELRLQKVTERSLQLLHDLGGETAAHQPDGVGAENPRRPAAYGSRVWQRILRLHRISPDERLLTDPAELMDR